MFRRESGKPPVIMGILNVTPDSFSDGGCWYDVRDAVNHAFAMIDEGAGIIDVGGESTRPGARPVSEEEELARILPVLKELIPSVTVPVSVDTSKTSVAEKCISVGATMVNDVNGLRSPGMPELVASAGVYAVIMHANGNSSEMPESMEGECMNGVREFLRERTRCALEAGISADRLIMDPGIGFGKNPEQNSEILENSSFFSDGYPVLSGSSRKRFLSVRYPGAERDEASALAARVAADSGADIVRVHNVRRTAVELQKFLSLR